jgi:hypothetical protein
MTISIFPYRETRSRDVINDGNFKLCHRYRLFIHHIIRYYEQHLNFKTLRILRIGRF